MKAFNEVKEILSGAADEIKNEVLRQKKPSAELTPGSVQRLNVKYGGLF